MAIFLRNLSCVLGIVCLANVAHGFGTVHFFGQAAEHEKITALALAPFEIEPDTLNALKGKPAHFGSVGVPDKPGRGLLSVVEAHCDGGDTLDVKDYPQSAQDAEAVLTGCRDWIFKYLNEAIGLAGDFIGVGGEVSVSETDMRLNCRFDGSPEAKKCNVIGAIGLAFHAAQDFYSHSNWNDEPADGPIGLENPPGLGKVGPADWLNPRSAVPFPTGLISGCYKGFPESLHCRGRVRHSVLNKDIGAIELRTGKIGRGRSTRGRHDNNFARAVEAAIADSRDKWRYVEEQIVVRYGEVNGPKIVCLLRKDALDRCL